ncbi:hypothetical protein MNV49_006474 [Pseudohyphozyma bogoriensis]|nr:hypothetical protein MNV49_006474 [Pseudohyphozyma bogoriensis]
MIHFPDRKAPHPHHPPAPHPYAPQSIIDSFSSFQAKLAGNNGSGAGGQQLAGGPAGGSAKGKGFESTVEADFENDWDLPKRFSRSGFVMDDIELSAIESGGASESPDVTKKMKKSWYNAYQF